VNPLVASKTESEGRAFISWAKTAWIVATD
jgi:hypothetical protein